MVIKVLEQKYDCGCNRGLSILEDENLLRNLNLIIEWDLCAWPKKLKEGFSGDAPSESDFEDNKKFLGEEPELKPGDCFLYKGQVIAVNSKDSLVLIVSETGNLALERIYEENIKPELSLLFSADDTVEVDWSMLEDKDNIPDMQGELRIPQTYRIWRERFLAGRGEDVKIYCTVTSDDFVVPYHFILTDYCIKYYKSEFSDDKEEQSELRYIVNNVLAWFCNNYSRKVNPLEVEETMKKQMSKMSK